MTDGQSGWARACLDGLARCAILIASASLIGMALVEGWQVFARYVLNNSPSWTEPVALLLMSTVMMLGAAVGTRNDAHFGFFIAVEAAPPSLRRTLLAIARLIAAAIGLLLAICVITVLGPGLMNTVIAIAIGGLPAYTRLARAAALAELPKDYVTASRVAGAGPLRLMFVAVLPNCLAPLIVKASLSFSAAILEAAGLGFLGLGVQAPTPEWGAMLASSRDYIERAPWVVTLPGLTILIAVLSVNLMGDGLRDALDPKLKKVS